MDRYIKSLESKTLDEVKQECEDYNSKATEIWDMEDVEKMAKLTRIYFAKARCCAALADLLKKGDDEEISKFFKQ